MEERVFRVDELGVEGLVREGMEELEGSGRDGGAEGEEEGGLRGGWSRDRE